MAPHDNDLDTGTQAACRIAADLRGEPASLPEDGRRRRCGRERGWRRRGCGWSEPAPSRHRRRRPRRRTRRRERDPGTRRSSAPTCASGRRSSENLIKRGIVGYADHLRVQPGETIKFMVSSEVPRYRADIVRLIHGDANPKGPGIKEEVVESPANGEYAGKRQELPLGSYAIVPDHPALRITGSFTFTAWIAPTSQRGTSTDSFVGVEGVLTKWAGRSAAATASSSTRRAGSRSG